MPPGTKNKLFIGMQITNIQTIPNFSRQYFQVTQRKKYGKGFFI